jgi:hypothetical protein
MVFYKEAVDELLRADEKEIWQALSAVTGHSVPALIRMARPPDYFLNPTALAGKTKYLARKTAGFIINLKKARKKKDALKKMAYLVKAVRKAVYLSGHSFNSRLLSVIRQIVGEDNFYISAVVTMPIHKENMFPERVPLYNEFGVKRPIEPVYFKYIFEDAAEIYHLF